MTSLYGLRWSQSFGPSPDEVQHALFSGMTWAQFRVGLEIIRKHGDDWPPSLPEFRRICLTGERDRIEGDVRAARMPLSRALPEPDHIRHERYEQARKRLAEARKTAGMAS